MTDQTERRSPHPSTSSNPAEGAFKAAVLRRIAGLANEPARLERFLNGLALDGTLKRLELPSGLAPMMRLPGPEPERRVRARMADLIVRRVSADGNVTREDLLGGGFTEPEILRHFHAAKRIAAVADMAA